jgi:glutamine synthetase
MNREPRTHANSTVNRDQDGSLRYVVVEAEYFLEDTEVHENDPDKYTEGVSARFRFDIVHRDDGIVARLDSVKDINDGAASGYDTNLSFMKAVPIAEDAVSNVPGVDEVKSIEGYLLDQLDKGRTAV